MSSPPTSPGDLRLLARIWRFVKPDAWTLVTSLALTPVIAGLSLAQPYLLKVAIDDHIVPGEAAGLRTVALLYLAAVVGSYLSEAAYSLALAWGGQRTILRLRRDLFAHTLGLAQRFFDKQPAGKLLTRLTSDVEALGESLQAGVVTILLDLLMIAGILATMFVLDWRLSLLLLCLAPPLLAALEFIRRRLRRLYLITRESLAEVNAFMAERIDGVEVVQLFGAERRTLARFESRNRRYRDATQASNVYDAAMFALVDGGSRIFVAALLWWGTGLAAEVVPAGWAVPATVGLLIAFMDYLERLFRPLREISGKITVIQRALAALQKIFWLLDADDHIADADGSVAQAGGGELVLEDVRFRYRPDGDDVLKGVSLTVRPGESVAVVGASGSGKTTLTRLLDRSYDGYRGSITLDGVELDSIGIQELRAKVASVRQDIHVFSESLRFNVDLGNERVSEELRETAVDMTHARGFVDRLGWSHELRERGADLSVGEGQLLTFARTMAHDPGVVILDEATASVDSLTEKLVQDAIGNILRAKTVIVIAHRLSTVQRCDRIAVMQSGEVVELGTHAELMALGGRYAELVADGQGLMGEQHATG
jgi:ATP-binding cassette subfamily B protein